MDQAGALGIDVHPRGARRLWWRETARAFQTRWAAVYRAVDGLVQWGLAHRTLAKVRAIGVDEIPWNKGRRSENFLTVIGPIDGHCRRRRWGGRRHPPAPLRRGGAALGPELVAGLRFICGDRWPPYLQVIAAKAGHGLHILDRFHIRSRLNAAVDQGRRAESRRLHGRPRGAQLKPLRGKLLRRGSQVRGRAKEKLHGLRRRKLAPGRAGMLPETRPDFWRYRSVTWAQAFLEGWCQRAPRRRLEPPGQSRPQAPGPSGTQAPLVSGQGRDRPRRGRGPQQQGRSDPQKAGWIWHLSRDGNGSLA